jgi:hypothetical protein
MPRNTCGWFRFTPRRQGMATARLRPFYFWPTIFGKRNCWCALILLLERETNRLSVRGGQTKAALLGLKTNSPSKSKKNVNGGGGPSSMMSQFQHSRMPEPDAASVLFTSRVNVGAGVGAATVSTCDTRPSQTQSQQAMPMSVPHSHSHSHPLPDSQVSWSRHQGLCL